MGRWKIRQNERFLILVLIPIILQFVKDVDSMATAGSSIEINQSCSSSGRRRWISTAVKDTTIISIFGSSICNCWAIENNDSNVAAKSMDYASSSSIPDSLPNSLKKRTALAPLGDPKAHIGGPKLRGQTLEQLTSRLSLDLTGGANGRGGYFISGDVTPEIFRDDCLFVDPTNSVNSLSKYRKALTILFDTKHSSVELIDNLQITEKKMNG